MTSDILTDGKLDFKYLPSFALFLKNNCLEELVTEQLRLAREIKVPLLKYFEGVPDAQLISMSMATTGKFLEYLIQNNAEEQISTSIKQWMENQLPQVSREQVAAEDITLVSFMRKESMLRFLPNYTQDLDLALKTIKELDRYIVKSETVSTNAYINLLKEGLAEEKHLKDSIADTAPGIIFIFDLEKNRHVYINEKVKELYGYEAAELRKMGTGIYQQIIHPDDLITFETRYQNLLPLKDGEVRSVEYRLKLKDGGYRWLKNYESVFKRSADGLPVQMVGFAINIDKEKKIAEQLVNSTEQLLEAQELAEIGSFIWNLKDETSESTPQINKILRLPEGATMQDFLQNVHPADRDRIEQAINNAIRGNEGVDVEYRFRTDEKEKILWLRGLVSFRNGEAEQMKGTVMDVTERHYMIQRLQRSEELYKQAQTLSHMGNWTWDIYTNKVSWTDELYRIFGLAPQSEEIDLQKFFSFIHPEDRETRIMELEASLRTRKPQAYDFRILLADGSIKILHGQAEVLVDADGQPFKMFGACQDVTQQKLVEKELLENQNFIRKIADATPSIIAAYNIHTGKYLFINQAIEKLLGYKKEEVLEQGLQLLISLVHPEDLQLLTDKNAKAIETVNEIGYADHEVIMDFKYRLRHRNGTYRWLHTYGTVFDRNANNEVEHILNISADITEMIEAETKVKEQEHFIQQVADASPTVLYLFDVRSASIIYVNKEIENVLGYSQSQVTAMGGNIIREIFHPEDAGEMIERLQQYNQQENPKFLFQFECRLRNTKGDWCWFLVREVVFRRNERGKVSEVLGAALDISMRKEMEDTLHHQTIALQQSNTSLEEFAYVASHDLKEPLRKISTFSDRLLTSFKSSLPQDAQSYLDKIMDSSRRMQQLIDDLLSISMISGEKNFRRYSLKSLVEEALQTLEHKIEEKKAIIHLQDLPEATVIPSQFRQLFQNLISNSLKFSKKEGRAEVSISYTVLKHYEVSNTSLNKSERYLQLKVVDNGIGFDKIFAEKIFTIFQRLHTRSQYEGTGIGLAICRRIVENHGGAIYASSEESKGATFVIIIPYIV